MRKIKSLFVLFACLCLWSAPVAQAAATRVIVSPTNAYISNGGIQDNFFPDYVVEFDIPATAYDIVSYSTSTGIEGRVYAYGRTFIDPPRNGRIKVKVIAGYRARKCSNSIIPATWNCNYTGTIQQFASTVRVRYYR